MPEYKPIISRELWEINILMDKLVKEGKMGRERTTTTTSGWRYYVIHEEDRNAKIHTV